MCAAPHGELLSRFVNERETELPDQANRKARPNQQKAIMTTPKRHFCEKIDELLFAAGWACIGNVLLTESITKVRNGDQEK
jgi:hypothetical protein